MKTSLFTTPLGLLRVIGFLEGLSFLILLCVAMPLKYLAHKPEAVKIVGMGHGVLFLAYLFLVALVAYLQKWEIKTILVAMLASLVPLGTFYADATIFSKK